MCLRKSQDKMRKSSHWVAITKPFLLTLKHLIGGFKYCFGVEPFGVAELTLQRRIGFYVPLDLPLF